MHTLHTAQTLPDGRRIKAIHVTPSGPLVELAKPGELPVLVTAGEVKSIKSQKAPTLGNQLRFTAEHLGRLEQMKLPIAERQLHQIARNLNTWVNEYLRTALEPDRRVADGVQRIANAMRNWSINDASDLEQVDSWQDSLMKYSRRVKTLNTSSSNNLAHAAEPDFIPALNKNKPYRPRALVHVRSLNLVGRVENVWRTKSGDFVYKLELVGPGGEAKGSAVASHGDLTPRRSKALKMSPQQTLTQARLLILDYTSRNRGGSMDGWPRVLPRVLTVLRQAISQLESDSPYRQTLYAWARKIQQARSVGELNIAAALIGRVAQAMGRGTRARKDLLRDLRYVINATPRLSFNSQYALYTWQVMGRDKAVESGRRAVDFARKQGQRGARASLKPQRGSDWWFVTLMVQRSDVPEGGRRKSAKAWDAGEIKRMLRTRGFDVRSVSGSDARWKVTMSARHPSDAQRIIGQAWAYLGQTVPGARMLRAEPGRFRDGGHGAVLEFSAPSYGQRSRKDEALFEDELQSAVDYAREAERLDGAGDSAGARQRIGYAQDELEHASSAKAEPKLNRAQILQFVRQAGGDANEVTTMMAGRNVVRLIVSGLTAQSAPQVERGLIQRLTSAGYRIAKHMVSGPLGSNERNAQVWFGPVESGVFRSAIPKSALYQKAQRVGKALAADSSPERAVYALNAAVGLAQAEGRLTVQELDAAPLAQHAVKSILPLWKAGDKTGAQAHAVVAIKALEGGPVLQSGMLKLAGQIKELHADIEAGRSADLSKFDELAKACEDTDMKTAPAAGQRAVQKAAELLRHARTLCQKTLTRGTENHEKACNALAQAAFMCTLAHGRMSVRSSAKFAGVELQEAMRLL